MTPILGAAAVVVHAGSVLLVQRRNEPDAGLWGYPGGKVDAGETVRAAAARELHEETGVIATPGRILENLDLIGNFPKGQAGYHFHLVLVECHYQSGNPQAADDALDARWVSLNLSLIHI